MRTTSVKLQEGYFVGWKQFLRLLTNPSSNILSTELAESIERLDIKLKRRNKIQSTIFQKSSLRKDNWFASLKDGTASVVRLPQYLKHPMFHTSLSCLISLNHEAEKGLPSWLQDLPMPRIAFLKASQSFSALKLGLGTTVPW